MFELLTDYQALVYVDSDARFWKFPALFLDYTDPGCKVEFAVHWRKNTELLSGTIFMKRTHIVFDLLKTWEARANMNPTKWDQKVLQSIVPNAKDEWIDNLPMEYCKIFDAVDMKCNPVIEHMQASRKWKRIINRREQ